MSYVTHAQNKDASAFKSQIEETLASKVVQVLEGLKAVVAYSMFEEGGISGGVSSVKKKPAPPAAGTVELPAKENKVKEGGLTHAGRSNSSNGEKSGEFVLPGQKNEGTDSFKEELQVLTQKLDEMKVVPGSEEHMAHHVHAVHTGDHGMSDSPALHSSGHFETQHYYIHANGYTDYDPNTNPVTHHKAIYNVIHKRGGAVHKFHVSHIEDKAGGKKDGYKIEHVGTL